MTGREYDHLVELANLLKKFLQERPEIDPNFELLVVKPNLHNCIRWVEQIRIRMDQGLIQIQNYWFLRSQSAWILKLHFFMPDLILAHLDKLALFFVK